jgi:hypothetical protein
MSRVQYLLLIIILVLFAGVVQAENPVEGSSAEKYDWFAWQELRDRDQNREALDLATGYREEARGAGDEADWARALIEEVKLHWSLGAHKTAAEHLLIQEWPQGKQEQALLALFKAQSLEKFLTRHSYRMREREKLAGDPGTDLDLWTVPEAAAEIRSTYARAWRLALEMPDLELSDLSLYLEPNTYPERIRGTFRDAVGHMWAEHLANTGFWGPRQESDARGMDLRDLTDVARRLSDEPPLDGHPLELLHHLMAHLHQWHLENERREAAYHARVELIVSLFNALASEIQQVSLRQELETLQADTPDTWPWWSYGQWRLARLEERGPKPAHLVRAHHAARKGALKHPESVGGMLCAQLMAHIETPRMSALAMDQDLPGRRTIGLEHTNLEKVHLRAWRNDWENPSAPYKGLLHRITREEVQAWIEHGEPQLAWSVDLPVTEDYLTHTTYLELPECPPGPYVVAISTGPEFDLESEQAFYLKILISDLVLQARRVPGAMEFQARSGDSGRPRAGVDIHLMNSQHRQRGNPNDQGLIAIDTLRTDARGLARWEASRVNRVGAVAVQGEDVALLINLHNQDDRPHKEETRSFIYTDRSVYRPGQTVFWKAVVYRKNEDGNKSRVVADHTFHMKFKDPNGQEVASQEVTTNGFGSVSGQFTVPDSGLLGNWRLETGRFGENRIRIEEYKRPTFEAMLGPPTAVPRPNRPLTVPGQARYYFGQPVTEGQVQWFVDRIPNFGHVRGWNRPRLERQTVAKGVAELDASGSFKVDFVPEFPVDLLDYPDGSFTYRVSATITSSGGETKEVVRSIRLGAAAIRAWLRPEAQFFVEGDTGHIEVKRTTLAGDPAEGNGTWEVKNLEAWESTPLPGDLPLTRNRHWGKWLTPVAGDTLGQRWDYNPTWQNHAQTWPEGEVQASGSIETDEQGLARIPIRDLPAGSYRLIYRTTDDENNEATARVEFLVAGPGTIPLPMPQILIPEKHVVHVGDTLRVLAHSGYPGHAMRLQVHKNEKFLWEEFLTAGEDPSLLEIPVTEEMRGGFKIWLDGLRDFVDMERDLTIRVPWDNKKLQVELSRFRDHLRPGQEESFQVRVTGPDSLAVAAGTVELLSYMYDRSLDHITSHIPPQPMSVFPRHSRSFHTSTTLGRAHRSTFGRYGHRHRWRKTIQVDAPQSDRLIWRRPRRPLAAGEAIDGVELLQAFDVEGAQYMVEVKSAGTERTVSSETFEKFAIDSVEDALGKEAGVVSRGRRAFRAGRPLR